MGNRPSLAPVSTRGFRKANSVETGFAVGHYGVCEFFIRVEFESQPSQACDLFIFVGSRSFFYEADEVVAAGGDFGEPEMSGRVGSGCAESRESGVFCLEPGQCFFRTVGLSAGSRATTFQRPIRSSWV